jgi:hypothetical protein
MMAYQMPLSLFVRIFGFVVYIVWFLPLFGYNIFKTRENRTVNLLFLIFTLLFVGNIYLYNTSIRTKARSQLSNLYQNDEKIKSTLVRYHLKSDSLYKKLDEASHENPIYEQTKNSIYMVKQRADELFNYIQMLKIEIIKLEEGKESPAITDDEINFAKIERLDETNVPSMLLIGSHQNGKVYGLKSLLIEYKDFLKYVIEDDPTISKIINNAIDLNDQRSRTSGFTLKWENYYFQGQSTGFVLITLSQIQSDIRYSESEVISYLFNKFMKEPIEKVNMKQHDPVVISSKSGSILFIEYDNEVDIAVPGIPFGSISASTTTGTIIKKGNHFIVRPLTLKDCSISVEVINKDHKTESFPPLKFNVINKPIPTVSIDSCLNDNISGNELLNSKGLNCMITSEFNIDFRINYEVISFNIAMNKNGQIVTEHSNNNLFTERMIELFSGLRKGDKLYIENIKAKGSDGTVIKLKGLLYTID